MANPLILDKHYNKQKGSVLLFSLILLTAITLGALVAMNRSTLQLRMVNNMQRDQLVFNSTYSRLANGYSQMNDHLSTTQSILTQLIDDETLSLDLYSEAGWTAPTTPDQVDSVSGTIQISTLGDYSTETSKYNLKNKSGSDAQAETVYYFTYTATGTDKSGQITSTQEIGVSYTAPSPQ